MVGGSINKFIINPSKNNWLKYGKFLAEPRQSLNFFQKKSEKKVEIFRPETPL